MTRNPAFDPHTVRVVDAVDIPAPPRLSLDTGLAHQTLAALREPHAHGHRCDADGEWFNPHAGSRSPCTVLTRLELLAQQVDRLSSTVHAAAHADPYVTAVAEGMTGLVMAELLEAGMEEEAAGWMQTARYAIEALAAALDPSAHPAAPEVDLTGTDWDDLSDYDGKHRAP